MHKKAVQVVHFAEKYIHFLSRQSISLAVQKRTRLNRNQTAARRKRFHTATKTNRCSLSRNGQKIEFAEKARKVFSTVDEPTAVPIFAENILTVIARNDSRLDRATATPVLQTLEPRP